MGVRVNVRGPAGIPAAARVVAQATTTSQAQRALHAFLADPRSRDLNGPAGALQRTRSEPADAPAVIDAAMAMPAAQQADVVERRWQQTLRALRRESSGRAS